MEFSQYQDLRVELRGAALYVQLARPDRLNALSRRLIRELRALFLSLQLADDVRVVVLSGQGRGFCAGLDLKDNDQAPGDTPGEMLSSQREMSDVVIAMRRCPQPIIALLNGAASGAGFGIALAADIRIGTPSLRMNGAFIKIGLAGTDMGVSYFLPRMVGSSVAAEYLLTGRFIDADAAVRLGIVSRIVPEQELEQEGDRLLAELLQTSPLGLRLTKDALNLSIDAASLEAVIAMEDRTQVLAAQGPNLAEGIAAFREKRTARFVN